MKYFVNFKDFLSYLPGTETKLRTEMFKYALVDQR